MLGRGRIKDKHGQSQNRNQNQREQHQGGGEQARGPARARKNSAADLLKQKWLAEIEMERENLTFWLKGEMGYLTGNSKIKFSIARKKAEQPKDERGITSLAAQLRQREGSQDSCVEHTRRSRDRISEINKKL